MESLLCDEEWLNSPKILVPGLGSCTASFYTTREDCELALTVCLHKEISYMLESGYLDRLGSSGLLAARFIAIRWFIKSRRRLNLSLGTVFDAANYLDRFISMNHCHQWKCWMIELLSVACLSIAVKFSEISVPLLIEFQMEGLHYSFQASTIQRMELTVLQALGWRLGCITPYSYVELLTYHLNSLQPPLHEAIISRATELLLGALSDSKFLAFRQCTLAVSALRCSLEELLPSKSESHIAYFAGLIPQDQKDDLIKCHKIMEERVADPLYSLTACGNSYCPSSPMTVITTERIDINDCYIDLSLFKVPGSNVDCQSNRKKRKREEETLSHHNTSCHSP